MIVVIQHQISDPRVFWGNAQQVLPGLPRGIRALQILPNKEMTQAVCVWEADSVEAVKQIIEPSVGHVSKNQYFAVEEANAKGLPS